MTEKREEGEEAEHKQLQSLTGFKQTHKYDGNQIGNCGICNLI